MARVTTALKYLMKRIVPLSLVPSMLESHATKSHAREFVVYGLVGAMYYPWKVVKIFGTQMAILSGKWETRRVYSEALERYVWMIYAIPLADHVAYTVARVLT
jgi:hypothetical protein